MLIIVMAAMLVHSCKKPGQCAGCFPADAERISLQFKNALNAVQLTDVRMVTSADSIIRIGLASIPGRDYTKFNESLNMLTGEAYQTLYSILFVSDLIENGQAFTGDRVRAIARVSRAGKNMLAFSFYLRSDQGFSKISELGTNITVLTGNSLEILFKEIVFPGQTKNSLIQVYDKEAGDFIPKNHVDMLMRKIQKYKQEQASSLVLPDEEDVCNRTFCLLVNDGNRCEYRNGNYICYYRRTCFANYLKEYITANQAMPSDSISFAFDSALHYGIRDHVLASNNFGNKYKDYYKDLSIVYSDNSDPLVVLKTARLLYEMKPFFNYLNNFSSNGSQVFLTGMMKAKIADLVTDFKSVYNDDYTEQIFQDILTDLAWAENKTVSQVIERFR